MPPPPPRQPPPEAPYTLRRIEDMLALSRRVLERLVEGGFVTPQRGARNEWRFTFQDVVLLRTAHRLLAAGIPARRVLASLKRLRSKLPAEAPLSGLRITAVGSDVAVHEGGTAWAADSGQLLLDFEVAAAGSEVAFLERAAAPQRAAAPAPEPARDAAAWFERGVALEGSDAAGAEAAYRRAIALAPAHADAYLNLGVMLAERGRGAEAMALYAEALGYLPCEPLLHFNRAVVLEDDGQPFAALQSYAECLALAPDFADAHYNAARLHDEVGQPKAALRHYSAYRRLTGGGRR